MHATVIGFPTSPSAFQGVKSKKQYRKSSHESKQPKKTFAAPVNGTISSRAPEADQSRFSKRKRDSELGHQEQNKKMRHEMDNDNEVSSSQDTDDSSGSENYQGDTLDPRLKAETEMDQGVSGAVSPREGSPNPISDATRSDGRPRKARTFRIGGKNQQKVGFFVEEEVKALEQFKIRFCNTHGIQGRTFDAMIQHSERSGDEWPVTTSICTKGDFWNDIYALIPDRDRRSVYRFMRRHYQDTTQKAHNWTPEQDDELVKLHAQNGPKWAHIAKLLGRSDDDVTQRWKNRLQHRDTKNTGSWSEAELRAFVKSLEEYRNLLIENSADPQKAGKDIWEMDLKSISWGSISNGMENSRTRQQCADKWRKIQKNLMIIRQTSDPNAVFDPAEAARRYHRSNSSVASGKSKEFVEDDDDDSSQDDDDDEETRIPSSTPAIIPKLEFAAEQRTVDLARVAKAPSVDEDSEASDEDEAATHSSPISEDSSSEERKLREASKEKKRKRKEKKEKKRRGSAAAEDDDAEDVPITPKEKKNKDKKRRKSDANGGDKTGSAKKKSKKERRKSKQAATDANDMSDMDAAATL